MYTCAVIVGVVIVISLGQLNDTQPNIINYLGNLLVFFWQSSLNVSFERHQTKFPASSPWSMQIFESTVNITFIQLSTRHDFLLFCHPICLCVLALVFVWLFSMQIPFHSAYFLFWFLIRPICFPFVLS